MNLFKSTTVASISLLCVTFSGASASTLTMSTFPGTQTVNQLNVGDSGDQTGDTISSSGNLNWYWVSSSTTTVFNYSIVYSPTSLAFAAAEVFSANAATFNFSSGCCGTFLAFQRNVGTSPSAPIIVTGSVSMAPGMIYLLEVGLYNYTLYPIYSLHAPVPYMSTPISPNGSYELVWNDAATASYSSVLDLTGGDPSYVYLPPPNVPLPATLPLFATGLGVLGLLGWRRKRKALAA